uniref:Lebercilin-like protein n=1 Tax=Catharus ustulatus TaxID=91951 RepID=A0A8C3TJR8_CATUS
MLVFKSLQTCKLLWVSWCFLGEFCWFGVFFVLFLCVCGLDFVVGFLVVFSLLLFVCFLFFGGDLVVFLFCFLFLVGFFKSCTYSRYCGYIRGKKWPAPNSSCLNSSFSTLHSAIVYQDKNATAQRISSARLHKIKELKNEKIDLQRRIEASSLENQALRELSRRHARAIDRYSSAESHLQELLAGHRHEMTHLRTLLKMSQEAERNTAQELKRVEAEMRRTEGDLKTLLVLSEDKALAEREELNRRLAVLNETLKQKDERIQSLEMQLKLNNSTFSRQLANESKKLLEATMTTKDLLMEINIIHQKIKEKDRQLYVQNIYANRMPKVLRDQSMSVIIFFSSKNNQEEEAVEEVEKEEKKPHEQQKKEARSEGAIPSKDPARQKNQFISSEAVENLHQGLHTSGAKCKAGSLSCQRQAGQSCRDTAESRGKISFGAYEPSFGQTPLAGQDSPSGGQGCSHLLPSERKTPDGALWGGLFARRQPLELQQHKGEGRQVRAAWQIPNSNPPR